MCILIVFFTVILAFGNSKGHTICFDGTYSIVQTILMHDTSEDPVGYQISAVLKVHSVHSNLLLVKLESPKLHIMSRKAPTPHGFISHSSHMDTAYNKPFLINIKDGFVQSIYVDPGEQAAMSNLKKGISSLFQFQNNETTIEENDSSGRCTVNYKNIDLLHIAKKKMSCQPKLSINVIKDSIWGGKLESLAETSIRLGDKGKRLENILGLESHTLKASITDFSVIKVSSRMELKLTEAAVCIIKSDENLDTKINEMEKAIGVKLKSHDLFPEKEPENCKDIPCPSFRTVLQENSKHLQEKELGTSKSALSMIRMIEAIKKASVEEIYSVINAKENKKILPQLLDIIGAAQTQNTHQAALKKLQINAKYKLDLCERYLWALSTSPLPNETILRDVLQIVNSKHSDPKLWQTLVLTLSAMTKKFYLKYGDDSLVEEVVKLLTNKLEDCGKEDEFCRQVYLKAFANLASPLALPTLMNYTVNSTRKTGVAAIHAISKLGVTNWNTEVIKLAERVYFETKHFDSSARTIALDMILATKPTNYLLAKVLSPLRHEDTPSESKEYLLQRLKQISDSDEEYGNHIAEMFRNERLYHYDTFAQGGLSSAFTRHFMNGGSLSTSQEVSSGILKRGNVHVNLHFNDTVYTLFTLGIFSSGLSSFVSDSKVESEEEETASAGLELTVLDVSLRPFVFFDGQGELMGHVWSGTGSTLTPAYQALLSLEQQTSHIALGSGVLIDLSLVSAASVDLSGQIEISLWNRNAVSLVQNSAGIAVQGIIKIDTHFVRTKVEFNLMTEPRLDLTSDIEFSNVVALCMQLKQPNSAIRYNTYKVERIPGSKHKLRKTRYKTVSVPGKTYALNAKNNEMCNLLFRDS